MMKAHAHLQNPAAALRIKRAAICLDCMLPVVLALAKKIRTSF